MINFSIFITLYAGITHAFETDHLLAVSNIVTQRNKFIEALKDGLFWGLGHTSTIIMMGVIMLFLKYNIEKTYFSWFEAIVGFMLVLLGVFRVYKWYNAKESALHTHSNGQVHSHKVDDDFQLKSHFPAFHIGLFHGLAGSGSLILLVMSKSQSVAAGLMYLLIFGVGSVVGMMLAASAFSLPFSQKLFLNKVLSTVIILTSAILCIVYGAWVMYKNIV